MFAIHTLTRRIAAALGLALAAAGAAQAGDTVGTSFPADFPVFNDASLGTPVIGFGGSGGIRRTPVIFLHGNDDTPYPTGCERTGARIDLMAQYFADSGYSASELWALGYQGTQCDQIVTSGFGATSGWTKSASWAHTNAANVPDLRRFVKEVMAYTGASKIDIVAHGMGVTLAREYARLDGNADNVRRFVAIEGPNQGTLMCSPASDNGWAQTFAGGYTPVSAVCQEIGSPNTDFLTQLNKTSKRIDPRSTLVIRNTDASYPYMPWADGLGITVSPSLAMDGTWTDFSGSPRIAGAKELKLSGQGMYDMRQYRAHAGIMNSPNTWQAAFKFLTRR